jgi:hypothetical protein
MIARAVILLFTVGAIGITACSKGEIRTGEGQFCSTDPSDDPKYLCDPGLDLVCIATYSQPVTNPTEAVKWDGGVRPVWVCRFACDPSTVCPMPGDVCCPGTIYGKTYDKTAACVPENQCASLRNADVDAGSSSDAVDGPAARPDAGAPDGSPDAAADAS